LWIENLPEVIERLGKALDRAGQGGSRRVRMPAPLQLLGDGEGLAIAAAQSHAVSAATPSDQCRQHGNPAVRRAKEVVDDEVRRADDHLDKADLGTDLDHVRAAPYQTDRILDPPSRLNHLKQGV